MGCNGSKTDTNLASPVASVRPAVPKQHSHIAKLNDDEESLPKVNKPKMKFASSSTARNMNKYMLKFNRIRKAYATIEAPFRSMWAEHAVRPHLQLNAVFSKDVGQHTKGQLELDELKAIINKPNLKRTTTLENITQLCTDLGLEDCITEANIEDTFKPQDGMVSFQQALVGIGNAVLNNKTLSELHGPRKRLNDTDSPHGYETASLASTESERGTQTHRRVLYKGFRICRDMFDDIDVDRSGEIDFEEFRKAFFNTGDAKVTAERMKEMDFDDNKAIDFDEFLVGIGVWSEDCATLDQDELNRTATMGNEV